MPPAAAAAVPVPVQVGHGRAWVVLLCLVVVSFGVVVDAKPRPEARGGERVGREEHLGGRATIGTAPARAVAREGAEGDDEGRDGLVRVEDVRREHEVKRRAEAVGEHLRLHPGPHPHAPWLLLARSLSRIGDEARAVEAAASALYCKPWHLGTRRFLAERDR